MRIEIFANGGSVEQMQQGINVLHTDISATIESLQTICAKLNNMTGGVSNLSDALQSVNRKIREENVKLTSLEQTRQKVDTFLSNTIYTDSQVAALVAQNEEKFFDTYTWLRPNIKEEKSWWEQRMEDWNKFWSVAGDALNDVWNGIVEFVKEHAVELIIGVVAIVLGAAIIALTGGAAAAFAPALLAGLKAAAISAVISGAISGVIALFTGDNILAAFGDGVASGFMWGGIFFAVSSVISAISKFAEINKIKKTQSYSTSQLQHEFKHAGDFGVKGTSNKATLGEFQMKIAGHIKNADTIIQSTFRGESVYVFYDSSTHLGTYFRLRGKYWAGWKLNAEQVMYHFKKGILIMDKFKLPEVVIQSITNISQITGVVGGSITSLIQEIQKKIVSTMDNT